MSPSDDPRPGKRLVLSDFKRAFKRFQAEMKQKSHAPALTDAQLAAKAGCPKLTVVNSRWVH